MAKRQWWEVVEMCRHALGDVERELDAEVELLIEEGTVKRYGTINFLGRVDIPLSADWRRW